jgi:hypothetical protein
MKRRQEFSSFSSSDSSFETKKVKDGNEDLIDLLFENIDMIDSYSSSSDSADSQSLTNSAQRTASPAYFKPSLPRILKRDIRKKIPIMFTNVINSSDFNLLSSFLKTFCRNDVAFTQVARDNTNRFLSLEMPTLDHLIYFLGGFQQMAPDLTFRLSEFQLKQRTDMEGTEIICQVNANCTAIYPVNPGHIAQHVLDHLPYDGEKPILLAPNQNKATAHLLDHYDLYNPMSIHSCGLPMLKTPSTKVLSLTLTFKVDEQNRIHRMSKSAVFAGGFPCEE